MSRNLPTYKKENVLTFQFWNWIQNTFGCCGVEKVDGWKIWSTSEGLKSNWKVQSLAAGMEKKIACMNQIRKLLTWRVALQKWYSMSRSSSMEFQY